MSFGFSIGDIVLLTQIASKAIESTREACGERDALTREVRSLHVVLQRLAAEIEKPESLLRRCDDSRADELNTIVKGCKRTLRHLESRLKKSGALEKNGKKTGKKTWQQFRFGNKEMPALDKLRQRLATHTQHIQLFMNLLVYESQGNIEQLIEMQGAGLINIRKVLNQLVAAEMAGQREGSELTTRTDDDKSIWKDLRRALINDGISSKKIDQHKDDITSYIKGLGESGILDEEPEDVDNIGSLPTPDTQVVEHVDEGKCGKQDYVPQSHQSTQAESVDSEEPRVNSAIIAEGKARKSDLDTQAYRPLDPTVGALASEYMSTDLEDSSSSSSGPEELPTSILTSQAQSAPTRAIRAQGKQKALATLNQTTPPKITSHCLHEHSAVAGVDVVSPSNLTPDEDALVTTALARIRYAQEEGKKTVQLSQDELDALEKKRRLSQKLAAVSEVGNLPLDPFEWGEAHHDALLASALGRIRRAGEKKKKSVRLSQEEIGALKERKRRLQEQSKSMGSGTDSALS